MSIRPHTMIMAAGCLAAATPAVWAANDYGFEFSLTPTNTYGFDAPRIGLRNTGAAQITGLQITLGDTSYNFDGVVDNATSGDVEFTVMNPDVVNDGIRSDVLEILYTNFDEGNTWSAVVDFDQDNEGTEIGSIEDARLSLFGTEGSGDDGAGTTEASQIAVTFEDGFVLQHEFPSNFEDGDDNGPNDNIEFSVVDNLYRFSQFVPAETDGGGDGDGDGGPAVVPTPAAAVTGLTLLASLGVARRRR